MSKFKIELHGAENYPVLSSKETTILLNAYHQTHNEVIKEKIIFGNMKLVLSLIQKYNHKEKLEDLFQVGIIGLIKAIENFDTSLKLCFSTYAVPLILGEIKRYIRDDSMIHISRSLRDISYHALRLQEEYLKNNDKDISLQELSQRMKVDEKTLSQAIASNNTVTSLSYPLQDNGNDLESVIPAKKNALMNVHEHMDLYDALNHLNQKELTVIKQRYFHDLTQSEIAQDLMISQAQVSRIEKQALHHLRNYMSY
ncbi:MAG: sigma-70 family RNA polymerase sigma factor [Erysipelotrichaceae bacterium]|nr:sigma-70 family RNA polymerase sigma factor [Erysipelotrichaceae bacterium]